MMNKVLLVGELVRNVTVQKTANGSVNSFIIATVRVPKDERKAKEVHFIYCKAFGKALPKVLSESKEGEILCVSGQVATTVYTTSEGEKEYRMEIWAENVKRLPDKMNDQKDMGNPSKLISDAVRHYDQWDYIGERSVHTLEKKSESGSMTEEKEKHLEPLEKILKEHNGKDGTDSRAHTAPNSDIEEIKTKALA
ncbi:single-stranded DNA-binding protein [Salinicoccus sp. ID82-1]|uniref:single-stranded DNA-binding protein n=1 Tax=Salinicoccus sp. ID82-1 TaxID=2820269 RepID=UPI001F1B9F4B|nr:single-stranded DNA-binding protein [Salinicoccus sp. ID82-1]MCG1009909.1 single-stranded DNA-binding protein [Salinicoccus sp. ID82-1]